MFHVLIFATYMCYSTADTVIVNTTYGLIEGKVTHNNRVREFTSIPYAKPPINELRFELPQKPMKWEGIFNATIKPWGCIQQCNDMGVDGVCPSVTKEDCLLLNIFTPNNINPNNLYPVLIYIHGGGFTYGFGGGVRLNASNVINDTQNVIIVLINYRLGSFGTLYAPSLNLYGNQLYYDQLMAFQWIYDNINAFNGDKDNIIIFGESAGAISVGIHLLNQTNTIIRGGIMESNVVGFINQTPKSWGNVSLELAELLGCNTSNNTETLSCLKSVSADNILKMESNAMHTSNASNHNWTPTVKIQPIFSIQQGLFNKNISVIIGSNANEYNLYFGTNQTQTPSQFTSDWNNKIGKEITENVINYYNVPMQPSDINVVNYSYVIQTDAYIRCPSRNITGEISIQSNKKAYFYHLNYGSPTVNKEVFPQHPLCWNAACHTSDLWYVFNNDLSLIGNIEWNKTEIILLKQIESYWTNFAFNGNNPNDGPNINYLNINWTVYNIDKRNGMIFDIGDNMQMLSNIDDNPCNFWDSQNYSWLNGV